MNSRTNATILDVAGLAGVSPATVSRCLNRTASVRPELRARVEAAVDSLGYVPNQAARALVSRRSSTVGAVLPSLDSALFGRALESLQATLADAGYMLFVAASGYDLQREGEYIVDLVGKGVEALVLVGANRDPAIYDLLDRKGVSYVLLWTAEPAGGHPWVGFDNRSAANEVTGYLLDMGHRDVAVISGFTGVNDRALARVEGVREALRERGLELPDSRVLQRPFGVNEGREALRTLVSRDEPPSAVVCGTDPLAYGAVFESAAIGVRVPEDLSVTGFDDMLLSAHITPALTTVRTPQKQMGELAARRLIAVLTGEEPPAARPLEFELVVRGSTGPPREGHPGDHRV
ncbi:MAG: LacI family DNA-binding transcriptional regulator [Thiotrichales bacterium]|nr:LacI family DNA-binding transcriptional regulator [Thiotrichales bacterium]